MKIFLMSTILKKWLLQRSINLSTKFVKKKNRDYGIKMKKCMMKFIKPLLVNLAVFLDMWIMFFIDPGLITWIQINMSFQKLQ